MNIDAIIFKAFEVESAYQGPDPVKRKEAKQLIKKLNQNQRALLIQILTNPDVQAENRKLFRLNWKLMHGDDYRSSHPFARAARALKNQWKGRIKSSVVLHEMARARADYETQLKDVQKPASTDEVEKRLQFFVNHPIKIDILNDFLCRNRRVLTRFAFDNPDQWLLVSKKIRDKLKNKSKDTNEARKLWSLFWNLARKINYFQVGQQKFEVDKQWIPKDILSQITSWLPAAETSIRTMQMLCSGLKAKEDSVLGAIDPQIFVSWMNVGKIKLTRLNLPLEDVKKIIPYLDKLDLTHLGLGEHKRQTHELILNKKITDEDLPWLSLFPDVKKVSFLQGVRSDQLVKLLKAMKQVEILGFSCNMPRFLKEDLAYLAQVKGLVLDRVPFFEGIECYQNLEGLVIVNNIVSNKDWKSISQLPKLVYLGLNLPRYPSEKLLLLKNVLKLQLSGTISLSVFNALSSLSQLKELHLDVNLSMSRLEHLFGALPNLDRVNCRSGKWERNN